MLRTSHCVSWPECYTITTTMSEDTITSHEENLTVNDPSLNINERDTIDDLILQNKTMDALIKGLTEDIVLLKG